MLNSRGRMKDFSVIIMLLENKEMKMAIAGFPASQAQAVLQQCAARQGEAHRYKYKYKYKHKY